MRKYRLGIEMDGALTCQDSRLVMDPAHAFSATLVPRAGSQQALEALAQTFQIVIVCTAVMSAPDSLATRLAWLGTHFSRVQNVDVVCCNGIHSLDMDIFVSTNIHHFEGYKGQGVALLTELNRDTDWPCATDGWPDAINFLRQTAQCLCLLESQAQG